jgi:hypothetical protein
MHIILLLNTQAELHKEEMEHTYKGENPPHQFIYNLAIAKRK